MVIRGRGAFRPELPAEMKRLERLNGVLAHRAFENTEHYSGLTDPQLADLLKVRPSRLAQALAQLNEGGDEERIAAAVARFNETKGEDEDADRNTVAALLREANSGELLVRIPVYGTRGPTDVQRGLGAPARRRDPARDPVPHELHFRGRYDHH